MDSNERAKECCIRLGCGLRSESVNPSTCNSANYLTTPGISPPHTTYWEKCIKRFRTWEHHVIRNFRYIVDLYTLDPLFYCRRGPHCPTKENFDEILLAYITTYRQYETYRYIYLIDSLMQY